MPLAPQATHHPHPPAREVALAEGGRNGKKNPLSAKPTQAHRESQSQREEKQKTSCRHGLRVVWTIPIGAGPGDVWMAVTSFRSMQVTWKTQMVAYVDGTAAWLAGVSGFAWGQGDKTNILDVVNRMYATPVYVVK